MLDNFPHAVRIKKILKETPLVRSYIFDYPVRALPGQFVNIWIPGVDEKPMSVAFDDGKSYTLAIAGIGHGTQELEKKKVGDYIGIRGPYGTHFTWKKKDRIAMLAGGYGAGPLYFAAELAVKDGCHVDFFLGARSKTHLLFADRIRQLKNTRFLPSTDDGSSGFKGTNVENWIHEMESFASARRCRSGGTPILKQGGEREAEMRPSLSIKTEKMEEGVKYGRVMTCGPELMMKSVSDIAWGKKIPAQVSIERYMKCGFGICGNCCVDDLGITTCQNGTVMENTQARKIKEFGVYHRDGVGRKHSFAKP